MMAGNYFWKQIQSTLAEYYMIILMNVRDLFYGKTHWRKGSFRANHRESDPSVIHVNISYLIFQNHSNSRITTSKKYCFQYQVASICFCKSS